MGFAPPSLSGARIGHGATCSRSRNAADDAVANPVLPDKGRGAFCLEVHFYVDPDLEHLAPGDLQRFVALWSPAPAPAQEPPSPGGMHPLCRRATSHEQRGDPRRFRLAELDDHPVDLPHQLTLPIRYLLIQKGLSQLHDQLPPRNWSGIATKATTHAMTLTT